MARNQALLLDFDGVLRHFPGQNELTRGTGLPAGAVHAAAFAPSRIADAITGRVSDAEWRAQIVRDLALRFPQARVEEAVRRWSEPVGELDQHVLSLVRRVREELRVVLVTNATTRLRADLEQLGLTRTFDAVVSSTELAVAKPDPRIFREALVRADVAPECALFVDDSVRNVEAAGRLGIAALHFAGVEGLRSALSDFVVDAELSAELAASARAGKRRACPG